jgi:hypothetical protein
MICCSSRYGRQAPIRISLAAAWTLYQQNSLAARIFELCVNIVILKGLKPLD